MRWTTAETARCGQTWSWCLGGSTRFYIRTAWTWSIGGGKRTKYTESSQINIGSLSKIRGISRFRGCVRNQEWRMRLGWWLGFLEKPCSDHSCRWGGPPTRPIFSSVDWPPLESNAKRWWAGKQETILNEWQTQKPFKAIHLADSQESLHNQTWLLFVQPPSSIHTSKMTPTNHS